jgi:hypothetical protein
MICSMMTLKNKIELQKQYYFFFFFLIIRNNTIDDIKNLAQEKILISPRKHEKKLDWKKSAQQPKKVKKPMLLT